MTVMHPEVYIIDTKIKFPEGVELRGNTMNNGLSFALTPAIIAPPTEIQRRRWGVYENLRTCVIRASGIQRKRQEHDATYHQRCGIHSPSPSCSVTQPDILSSCGRCPIPSIEAMSIRRWVIVSQEMEYPARHVPQRCTWLHSLRREGVIGV